MAAKPTQSINCAALSQNLAQCSYSKLVWDALAGWFGVQLQEPPSNTFGHLKLWWSTMLKAGATNHQEGKVRPQKLIYTAWSLWKERCRRVFNNKALAHETLPMIIKHDAQH
jgi:hypothetical protein